MGVPVDIHVLTDAFMGRLHAIKSPGIGMLAEYLMYETDFFEAPASAKYHGAYPGGLVEHSIAVHDFMLKMGALMSTKMDSVGAESIAKVSLLHDLCKANFYEMAKRNVKNNETGQWEQVPYFAINDQFPVGHGEKSALIVARFIHLSDEEIAAIRWHMGGFDEAARGYAGGQQLGKALEKYPLVSALHIADMGATYLTD